MIVFANSKINIGLNIIGKRNDGFHNIQSVFYPIKLSDVIEFVKDNKNELKITGISLVSNSENLIIKSYNLLAKNYKLPPLKIHLHKITPTEAGLGGGSADATYILMALNNYFKLNISIKKLYEYADKIGSDCSFFVENKPTLVTGKGEKHILLPNFLKGKYLVVVKPDVSILTKEAFKNINIDDTNIDLSKIYETPILEWKKFVINDFEIYAFKKFQELKEIKDFLYNSGAEYASMSGSGSSIYGIFNENPNILEYKDYFVWNEVMS